jgi:hypothetical protein
MKTTTLRLAGALFCAGLTAAQAAAQAPERVSVSGFGGYAFGDTNTDNDYGYLATQGGAWDNANLGLNLALMPTTQLTLRSQGSWSHDLRDSRFALDYGFAEWRQSSKLKIRAGKAPVPFGIYTEVYDVGTLRPFYLLPQFYAGPLGLIPKAYLGAGVTGVAPLGQSWELQYDAFGGEIRFEQFSIDSVSGFDSSTGLPTIDTQSAQLVGRQMIGGRLVLASPVKGFDVGGTVFHSNDIKQKIGDGPLEPYSVTKTATFVNARAQYQHGPLAARAEWFAALADGADVKSYYVESSWRIAKHWQLAAQYERSNIVLNPGDTSVPQPLTHHESIGLGVNYWWSPRLVIKLDAYHVNGNMIARPQFAGLRAVLGTIDQSTTAVVAGAQFAF